MPRPDYFPVGAKVVLNGLQKAPELNGKAGTVKSGLTNGRQHVLIDESGKSVALKVSNLNWEGRSIESLSVKELKTILKFKNVPESEISGIDKSELQSKVANLNASPETITQWLLEASQASRTTTKTHTPSPATNTNVDASQAADQLANMNPEQLRQQARMMRSMPPDQIRRMNPQLANMTNAQILQAASQMEMMASNPAMMRSAAEQMKNMSPEEIQRMQQQAMGGAGGTGGGGPATSSQSYSNNPSATNGTTPNPVAVPPDAPQAADMVANMTPEQLKQQADMFGSMPPDQVRAMNPQLAHMTDDQIKAAATQFRMMAENPEMMKMAMDQMKNLSPEQIEQIRQGKFDPNADPAQMMAGGDPSEMLAKMDKKQLKSMLKSLKENPEMMKQFAASAGLGEDKLGQGVDMFADMDDAKLDMVINMMKRAQYAKETWTKVDAKVGGHLKKIIAVLFIITFSLLIHRVFFSGGSTAPGQFNVHESVPVIKKIPEVVEESEF